ncbi:MAG: sensor histidine kinase [Janthinobacterium lividum]
MPTGAPLIPNEVRLRSLFENSPELILFQDTAGIILDANPAFLALVEEPKERVLNRPFSDFLPVAIRSLFAEKLREAAAGHTVRFDMYTAPGHSETRHWDVVKIPLQADGQVLGVHMLARDITEKTRIQEELAAQNRDLQQFNYIVSHNLRAPLANALGLAEMLDQEVAGSPEFEQTRTFLLHNLHQLDQVLRDMNTILSIRDKQGLTLPEPVVLLPLAKQVVRSLQDVLDASGGAVELRIPAELHVLAQRAYLYSIFFNLLSNAIKYRAAQRPLHVVVTATRHASGETTLEVADNGSGFDQAQAGDNVFKLYQRFHPQHSGRGLGLYLVKAHVERLGGRVEVTSQVDKGAHFTILLPAPPATPSTAA